MACAPTSPAPSGAFLTVAVLAAFVTLLAIAMQTLSLQTQTVTTLVSNTEQTVNISAVVTFRLRDSKRATTPEST